MTESQLFDVLFDGRLMTGAAKPDVVKGVASLFKISNERAEALFDGAARPIKSKVEQAVGLKYVAAMRKVGAMCRLSAHATSSQKPSSARSQNASDAAVEKPEENPAKKVAEGAPERPSTVVNSPTTTIDSTAEIELGIAEVGSIIETLASEQELVDADKLDLNFDIAALGSIIETLSNEAEIIDSEKLDLSFDVAAAGSEMLANEFKEIEVVAAPDIIELSIASGDFDLREGQKKEDIPPPPDTSAIKGYS